jgi:hypothetical protein
MHRLGGTENTPASGLKDWGFSVQRHAVGVWREVPAAVGQFEPHAGNRAGVDRELQEHRRTVIGRHRRWLRFHPHDGRREGVAEPSAGARFRLRAVQWLSQTTLLPDDSHSS